MYSIINETKDIKYKIKQTAYTLGFKEIHFTDTVVDDKHKKYFLQWLSNGYQANLQFLNKNIDKRFAPEQLLENTRTIITVQMNYYIQNNSSSYIANYASGKDYHKLMRKKLQLLASSLNKDFPNSISRPFVDSAPVLERYFSQKSGAGFVGKNTMLINTKSGSFFFLGQLFTSIQLEPDMPHYTQHCGSCVRCIDKCPTKAIVTPYTIDANKCISYLTIEHSGSIQMELRHLIGNRVFGCDDCILVCPFTKFSQPTSVNELLWVNSLYKLNLLQLFNLSEQEFNTHAQGTPIKRVKYNNFIRNVAVALGNEPFSKQIIYALLTKKVDCDIALEHINWAYKQQISK